MALRHVWEERYYRPPDLYRTDEIYHPETGEFEQITVCSIAGYHPGIESMMWASVYGWNPSYSCVMTITPWPPHSRIRTYPEWDLINFINHFYSIPRPTEFVSYSRSYYMQNSPDRFPF